LAVFLRSSLSYLPFTAVELIQRQTLETTSNAWKKNNYKAFIKSIDEIGIENLPKSYQSKYKIAK